MEKQTKNNFRNTALGIILNREGRILICKSPRHNNEWKFPQGGIENSETPKEAVIREIKEELSVEITEKEIIFCGIKIFSYYFENGFEIKLHPFLIEFKEKKEIILEKEEFTEMLWLKPFEIFSLNLGIRANAYREILKYFKLHP